MLYRKLGASDINASVVALGAWAIGGWMWGGTDDDLSIQAINTALDNGINFIDTAPIYGYGHSETIVGKAIAGKRDKVVLATKCGLVWDKEKGDFHFNGDENGINQPDNKYKVYKYLGPESIVEEVHQSLKRLNTDYIDLYQTHWQDSTTPIEDTMAALVKLRDEGKIRAIGISNANTKQLQQYGAIDCDQERFSMIDRKIEKNGTLKYCSQKNIAVLAYSPMVHGLLTGKLTPDRKFNIGDLRKDNPRFSIVNRQAAATMLNQFDEFTEKYKCSLTQLVIAWTFHQPGLTHVLCGIRNDQQAIENAAAGDITIDQADIDSINQIIEQSDVE